MTTTERLKISDMIMESDNSEVYELFELVLDMVDWKLYNANLCDDFYANSRPLLEKLASIANVKE